jgi:hypothetical protein
MFPHVSETRSLMTMMISFIAGVIALTGGAKAAESTTIR